MGNKFDCFDSQVRHGLQPVIDQRLNPDDSIIEKQERLLGFYDCLCNNVEEAFNKSRFDNNLTAKQLVKIMNSLQLKIQQSDKKIFYKKYDRFQLKLIAVYLSRGNSYYKAEILYDLIEKDLYERITSWQFQSILVFVYKYIIEVSLLLCKGILPNQFSQEKIDNLQKDWKNKFEKACKEITKQIFFYRNSLPKEDFVEQLGGKYQQYLTTRGLRRHLFNIEENDNQQRLFIEFVQRAYTQHWHISNSYKYQIIYFQC